MTPLEENREKQREIRRRLEAEEGGCLLSPQQRENLDDQLCRLVRIEDGLKPAERPAPRSPYPRPDVPRLNLADPSPSADDYTRSKQRLRKILTKGENHNL